MSEWVLQPYYNEYLSRNGTKNYKKGLYRKGIKLITQLIYMVLSRAMTVVTPGAI